MTWQWILLLIYTLSLGFILLFSISQLLLTFNYWFKKKNTLSDLISNNYNERNLPFVSIQLPVFNEKYVVERLIDNMVKINYPKDKLQIQILDDSTDETSLLAQQKVDFYKIQGFDIQLIRRTDRTGYKAGALKNGLDFAKGEFIAIFDADFMVKPDFLLHLIPIFSDPKVGVVQSRWGHLNENYSFITRLQAFALDAHFTVEQVGRNAGNHFINFNGTAGIWRKNCILDAGNWQADTLTEDLDLSYRAQMKGWKFRYFEGLESPAELPVTMNDLKAQQGRWTKGAAETARKHLVNIWKSDTSILTKIIGSMHLLNSAIFIAFMISSLVSVPVLVSKTDFSQNEPLFRLASVFIFSLFSLVLFYGTAFFSLKKANFNSISQFLLTFPLFTSLVMGLSLHNAVAVLEGYFGKKTAFVRTPKFNIREEKNAEKWIKNSYRIQKISFLTWLELILAFYFTFGFFYGISKNEYDFLLLHGLMSVGFFAIFVYSVKHSIRA
jgi:cellulose synthase/poly-beta-1,6-N-acetylglucosamine synthase-like glycosyltransferase